MGDLVYDRTLISLLLFIFDKKVSSPGLFKKVIEIESKHFFDPKNNSQIY